MANGLMQSLAFFESKDENVHIKLQQHILNWLCKRKVIKNAEYSAAMEALFNAPSIEIRRATEETLAILRWIRQFAPTAQR